MEKSDQQEMKLSIPSPLLSMTLSPEEDLPPKLSISDERLAASCRVEQLSQEPSQEHVPLPFSQQQSAARARVMISGASRVLMSSLAALDSLISELSWRLLKFSGACFRAAVYIL